MLLVSAILFFLMMGSAAISGAASALLVSQKDYNAPPVLAAVLITLCAFHFLNCCKLVLTTHGRTTVPKPPIKIIFLVACFFSGMTSSLGENLLFFISFPTLSVFQVHFKLLSFDIELKGYLCCSWYLSSCSTSCKSFNIFIKNQAGRQVVDVWEV